MKFILIIFAASLAIVLADLQWDQSSQSSQYHVIETKPLKIGNEPLNIENELSKVDNEPSKVDNEPSKVENELLKIEDDPSKAESGPSKLRLENEILPDDYWFYPYPDYPYPDYPYPDYPYPDYPYPDYPYPYPDYSQIDPGFSPIYHLLHKAYVPNKQTNKKASELVELQ